MNSRNENPTKRPREPPTVARIPLRSKTLYSVYTVMWRRSIWALNHRRPELTIHGVEMLDFTSEVEKEYFAPQTQMWLNFERTYGHNCSHPRQCRRTRSCSSASTPNWESWPPHISEQLGYHFLQNPQDPRKPACSCSSYCERGGAVCNSILPSAYPRNIYGSNHTDCTRRLRCRC